MKNTFFLSISAFLFLIAIPQLKAQVGVGTSSPQGALDITSDTNGVVVPRVALTSKSVAAPIVNPQTGALAAGTLVWNTAIAGTGSNTVTPGFYFWQGGQWNELADGSGKDWSKTGNTGTDPTTHFMGTTDNTDLVFKTDYVTRMTIHNSDVDPITGTAGDIAIGDATSGTIKANKELVMRQDNDTEGSSVLRLRNRFAENGAIFETIDADNYLVDFIFKTGPIASPFVSNIRFETRTSSKKIATNNTEFHFGKPSGTDGGPTLVVGADGNGSNSSFRRGNLGIGTVDPQEKLHVDGNTSTIRIDGLNSTNNANNDGSRNVPVSVDANGNLVLEQPTLDRFTNNENILPTPVFVENKTANGLAAVLCKQYVIASSAEERFMFVSYQTGVLVTKHGGSIQLSSNHESKLFGATIVISTNAVVTWADFLDASYGRSSVALSGDKYFSGKVFLNGQGMVKLNAGTTYYLNLVGFVQNNNEIADGIRATYGGNGNIDRFQFFEMN